MKDIDEAIKDWEESADQLEKTISYYTIQGDTEWLEECEEECIEHAANFRQLAKWLKELKAFKEAMIKIPNASVDVNLGQIPINNRSYEDITKCLMLAYEQGITDTISRIEKYVKRDQLHDPLIDEVVKSGAPFKKWLESFNTESASVCFNKIQELKGIVGAGSEKNTQGGL